MTDTTHPDEEQWAGELDATVQQIRDAIRAGGADKAAVEMYLKGSHASSDADVAKRAGA